MLACINSSCFALQFYIVLILFKELKMSRKVILTVVSKVTVLVDDGLDMDDLELSMYSDSDAVDVEDCEIEKIEVLDSK